MDAAVKNLTEEDIVNIVAYTASLDLCVSNSQFSRCIQD